MKILTLNCQQAEQSSLKGFLEKILKNKIYDLLLLQEVDDKVASFLVNPRYKIIREFNEEAEQISQICIVYRSEYDLVGKGFQSFSSMRHDRVRGFKHPCMGILWVDIKMNGRVLRASSIHLHSGLDRHVRLKELERAKKTLLNNFSGPIILAGDFNAGFFRERINMARILAPEFQWSTKDCGPTLDSRFSENTKRLLSRVAAFLSVFNFGVKLHSDHFFVKDLTVLSYEILPNRVSDHSPVELNLIQ